MQRGFSSPASQLLQAIVGIDPRIIEFPYWPYSAPSTD